jgi:hypothetical protein
MCSTASNSGKAIDDDWTWGKTPPQGQAAELSMVSPAARGSYASRSNDGLIVGRAQPTGLTPLAVGFTHLCKWLTNVRGRYMHFPELPDRAAWRLSPGQTVV